MGFRHSQNGASPVCHQIIGFLSFAIMIHAHPTAMPFHSIPIHFRFSYIFFDWIFQKYPYPHRLFALVLLVSHPSSLCCSHGRRRPRHAMALGQRPLQICQGQGHHVTVRRAGHLGADRYSCSARASPCAASLTAGTPARRPPSSPRSPRGGRRQSLLGATTWALSAAAAAKPSRGAAWTVRGGYRRSLLGAAAWALSPAAFHTRPQGGAGNGRGV